MKARATTRQKQSGIALLMILAALIIAGGYAFYRSANLGFSSNKQDAKLTLTLARAKEALIAYAVIDDKRPGRMPCPAVIDNGVSPILTRDDCDGWAAGSPDFYAGWIPWKTLDLAEPNDDTGSNFHYVTSRFFGGDRNTPALNSKTLTSLRVDIALGAASNDIVAIIIATRGTLDTRNSDGDEYFFTGTSKTPENNDVIAVITRQELMAAVEKRIATEVKNCLVQHAASPANPDHSYPWPAPLSNSIFKGKINSLFGMIPATQPGGNPDAVAKKTVDDLSKAKIALETASTATSQQAALVQVQEIAAYARAFFDRIYIVASDLEAKAKAKINSSDAKDAFATLDDNLAAVTVNTDLFNDGASGIPATINSAFPSILALRESLANSGFDIFLMELEAQNLVLKSKIDSAALNPSEASLGALQTQANVLKSKVLGNSFTPNPDINNVLSTSLSYAAIALTDAQTAKNSSADSALVRASITSATSLYNANVVLVQTVQASRLNVDPDTIQSRSTNTSLALSDFSANPVKEMTDPLISSLDATRLMVVALTSGTSSVITARNTALNALNDALTTAKTPGTSISLIQSTSNSAINQLNTLVTAMKNNGDNITQETLKNAAERLISGVQTPPTTLANGRLLEKPAADISYWATVTANHAADIAQKARKTPSALGDSENSAYSAARKLLNSLDGETGSIETLNKYIKEPGSATTQLAAQTALAKTQSLLTALLTKASGLEGLLEAGLADAAIPTKWYGNACAALKPPTGSDSWWTANGWADFVFYQISNPTFTATPGRLQVNQSGNHRLVVINAGRELLGQDRVTRNTTNYFEGINADATRNGDATTPAINFISQPPSATFNDRLAY